MSQSEQSLQTPTKETITIKDANKILELVIRHIEKKNCSHCKRVLKVLQTKWRIAMTNKNAYKDNAYYQKSIKNPDFIKKLIELAEKAKIKLEDEQK